MSAEVVQLEIDEALDLVEEAAENVDERPGERCEECGGLVVQNRHERVCQACGLVVQLDVLDCSGGVRTSNEPGDRSPRTSPVNSTRHDGGLTTTFNVTTDGQGSVLSSDRQQRVKILQMWNERSQSESSRCLRDGLGEVDRVADAAHATRTAKREARRVYRQARDADVLGSDRCVDSVAAAAVIIGVRRHGPPMTIQNVVSAALVDKQRVHRALSDVRATLDESIPPVDARAFMSRTSRLDCDDVQRLRRTAHSVLDAAEDADLVGFGEQPQTACASAVYAAVSLTDGVVTQGDVSDVFDVGVDSIRTHYRDYLDAFVKD